MKLTRTALYSNDSSVPDISTVIQLPLLLVVYMFTNLPLLFLGDDPSQFSGVLDCADLQFRSILLQYRLVVVFPELLGSVLACYALEDLSSTWMLVDER